MLYLSKTDKQSFSRGVYLAFLLFSLSFVAGTRAQVMDNSRRVDYLSMAERLSLRTNVVDWSLMVPNIGIEYDL